MNGVCVRWKGYLDLERLDGVGAIEFDEDTANLEDAVMRDTVEAYNRRIKDFEEHNKARQRQLAAFMGHQQQVAAALQAQQTVSKNTYIYRTRARLSRAYINFSSVFVSSFI